MYSIKGNNPTKLYYQAITDVMEDGDTVSPRGKKVKEIRPASVEFTDPTNRITFLKNRKVNPFFMLAESLWIISGHADTPWLCKFNANMKTFSDDGENFNASYGERIRSYGKNDLHGIIINPVDQMYDAYRKLLNDKDTRQAVIVISAPMFDNSKYTIDEQGKDIACNLVITFKIRNNKLNMTVFNRSNDVHWGLWGANLCQFTTIQEMMCSWLRNSGKEEFKDIEIGEYCQVTDSLHIYLDDYGSDITDKVLEAYGEKGIEDPSLQCEFKFRDEPRMNQSYEETEGFLKKFWNTISPFIIDDSRIASADLKEMIRALDDYNYQPYYKEIKESIDDYWLFAIKGMIVYRLYKIGEIKLALDILNHMRACQWKASMLYFLKNTVKKSGEECIELYNSNMKGLIWSLSKPEEGYYLREYLSLEDN